MALALALALGVIRGCVTAIPRTPLRLRYVHPIHVFPLMFFINKCKRCTLLCCSCLHGLLRGRLAAGVH